ncbi:hypothetical protein PG993_009726 [Apiospora rasikravindrae]|uniref:Uncharacterized protein n=1 Tax=Apiospora rasikravindrae TaxID=990691 RepID=A0ABR1SLK0_9PEZI
MSKRIPLSPYPPLPNSLFQFANNSNRTRQTPLQQAVPLAPLARCPGSGRQDRTRSRFSTAQKLAEVGLVCPDLWGPQNPSKKDPNGRWIIETSMCEAIGGTLYADDIICCPKSDEDDDIVPYLNECNGKGGTTHWPFQYGGTPSEIVPADWRCPK